MKTQLYNYNRVGHLLLVLLTAVFFSSCSSESQVLGVSHHTQDLWNAVDRESFNDDKYNLATTAIDCGAEINASNVFGETALHLATQKGNIDAVAFLLDERARLSTKDFAGKTPLHYAAERKEGRQLISCALIRAGAAVDVVDDNGCAPLHHFVKKNQKNVLEYLLKDRFISGDMEIDVDVKDKFGMTPLHHAAKGGNKRACSLLLGARADGNAKDKFGMTPLHYAAKNGCLSIIKALLRKEANFNAKDKDGMTLLHYAAKYGRENVVKELLETKEGQDGINIGDKYGMTPLMFATEGGHCSTVYELLSYKKCEVDLQDRDGWSALHHALGTVVDLGRDSVHLIRIVAELKKFGANVELKNNDGETPYDLRVQRSQRDGR